MAIVYTTALSESKWLLSENNNILEFYDDSITRTPSYCEIDITGIETIRLYPHPDGSFWFNCKDYISSLLNNYEDDLDFSTINPLDIDTFVYDWSRIYLNVDFDITITFTNAETETDTVTPFFLLSAQQLKDYKKGRTIVNNTNTILSPVGLNASTRFYLKYWDGYPFDFGYVRDFNAATSPQTITNNTNAITSPNIALTTEVSRIVFYNGETTTTLEDYLPLVTGYNELEFNNDIFIDLWKFEATCGVYLKWLNEFGCYNYWLFNEQHESTLSSKSRGVINNDFKNIADTVSTFKSLGRNIGEQMSISVDFLTADDINVLKGIVTSPKVYLFTGERFTDNTFNDWIEVDLSNKEIAIRDFKNNVPEINLTLNLPNYYTINL